MLTTTSREFIGTSATYAEKHKSGFRIVAITWGDPHSTYRFFENEDSLFEAVLTEPINMIAEIFATGRIKNVKL